MRGMSSDRSMLQRVFSGLPDAITAVVFATMWIAPQVLGPGAIRSATLLMLVEFLIVHATGFVGAFALDQSRSRPSRVASILGFALFYLGFVAAFAWSFQAWWPFLAFGWLLLSKILVVFEPGGGDAQKRARLGGGWALSAIAYVLGAVLTAMLPIPRLGVSEAVQAAIGAPGSGAWIEEPQRVLAFGLFYFGFLAWTKWKAWDDRFLAPSTPARGRA
jgi:hypothetical protein